MAAHMRHTPVALTPSRAMRAALASSAAARAWEGAAHPKSMSLKR